MQQDPQEEIWADLESTLYQLIQNEKLLIQEKNTPQLDVREHALLRRTQESLAARFLHRQDFFTEQSRKKERYRKLEDILLLLQNLNPALLDPDRLPQSRKDRPRIGRNRKRSKTGQIAYCNF